MATDNPYSTGGSGTDTPSYGQIPRQSPQSYSEPKSSLIDELLPLPSTSEPSNHSRSITATLLHSLRRLTSLTIILSFLLTILYYTSFIHPQSHYGTSRESISLRTAEVGWKNFVNTYGKVLGDGEEVKGLPGQGAEDGLDAGLDISGEEEQEEGDTGGEGEEGEGLVWEEDEWVTEIEFAMQDHHSHDYAQYTYLRTLPPSHVDVSAPKKRVIFVGDVHGMMDSLRELLARINFNSEQDLLIHVGDLIAKGPEPQQVVNFLRTNKARGVRGNHDEKVIEWRNWMMKAGLGNKGKGKGKKARGEYDDDEWRDYIDELDVKYGDNEGEIMSNLEVNGKSYPRSWKWRSEHWKIAREMSRKDFEYFVSLPLAIHLPSLHTVVVHAGLLARDPTLDAEEFKQPWAEMFDQFHDIDMQPNRNDAEVKLLQLIPQNRDPYTLLNIRSVLDNGVISKKSNEGTPWSDIWKQEMNRCTETGKWDAEDEAVEQQVEEESVGKEVDEGIEGVEDIERRKKNKHKGKEPLKKLPNMNCSPLTVIYGHAAGRGLDIKPFSKGLDSGCVYGRQLTALVLGDIDPILRLPRAKNVRVGDHKGVLIDVDCPKGTETDPKK